MSLARTTLADQCAHRTVTLDIINAVAEAEGVSPLELHPRLYDVIDPDALESLLCNATAPVTVRFEYAGWELAVGTNTGVTITGAARDV